MDTLAFINTTLSNPTFSALGSKLADRWYLDQICRRNIYAKTPRLYGSPGLTGRGVTVFIISSGVKNSPYFSNRLSWLLGDTDVDLTGAGTGMAFLVGANRYGVAPHCQLVSLNVYNSSGIDATLYQQAVNLILNNLPTGPCIVLSNAIRTPARQYLVVNEDLDKPTLQLLNAGLPVVVPAGDGFFDLYTGLCLGPILAEACHPAHLEEVITVSAFAEDLTIPSFANYGYAVNVFAPGYDIPTLNAKGKFTFSSTTRLSAALVTGILVLYLEKKPKATRSDLLGFIKDHSCLNDLTVKYPLERLQKDPFFNETYGYLTLCYSSGIPFPYLVDTKVEMRTAQLFFTKAVLEKPVISLGSVLANTQFEVSLQTKFKNLYGEAKPTDYVLLSYTPATVGRLAVGRSSGLLFGYLYEIAQTTICTLVVQISDGLYLTHETFQLTILPNYLELQTIGGVIKARLQNVSGMNIHQQEDRLLNIHEKPTPLHDTTVTLNRDIYLFDAGIGSLIDHQFTHKGTGEFLFTVPLGNYRAIVFDPTNQYNAISVDGLKASPF